MAIQIVAVEQALAADDMQKREGEGRIAAGEGLEMEIGRRRRGMADRIDDDLAGRGFRQPLLMGMRGRGRRVGAPDQDAGRVARRARIEAGIGAAEDEIEGHMAGEIADAVGLDLAGAQPVEEAGGKAAGDEGAGAGVMGMPDSRWPALRDNALQPGRDLAQRLVPGDGGEAAFALGADALQGMLEPLGGIAPDAVIGQRAFAAEGAAGDRMIGVAHHLGDDAPALDHGDAAAVVAVPRAGGADDGLVAGHGASPILVGRS